MARPPRIQPFQNHEKTPVYFLTVCIEGRKPVLANAQVHNAFERCLDKLHLWHCFFYVIMPDHIHLVISPLESDLNVSGFLKWFKRWMNEELKPAWTWQEGGFDHLLRSHESAEQKWNYVRDNPVRKGLCPRWQDWPYSRGF